MSIEVVVCKKCGMHYNGVDYAQCPYCANGDADKNNGEKKKTSSGSSWAWPWKKTGLDAAANESNEPIEQTESKDKVEEEIRKKQIRDHLFEDEEKMEGGNISKSGKTVGMYNAGPIVIEPVKKENVICDPSPEKESEYSQDSSSFSENRNVSEQDENEDDDKQGQSLAGSVQKLGKTTGKYISSSNGRTIEPVVGWLIGVKGVYYGQAFILKTGVNKVGRANTMDVALMSDDSVSRDIVVRIIYDSKGNEFNALPGESSSLCYIDGKALYGKEKLEGYEELEFGDSEKNKFIFVPLCGAKFQWNNFE